MARMLGWKLIIEGGPSKFDLMGALFEGESEHRRKVKFLVRILEESPEARPTNHWCYAVVNLVQRNGYVDDWKIEGEVVELEGVYLEGKTPGSRIAIRDQPFSGTFSTKYRRGKMQFA